MFKALWQRFQARPRRCKYFRGVVSVSGRQEVIPGWDQAALAVAVVLLIGGGGLNGEIAVALVRQGVGYLHVCDGDRVTPTNLNRQPFSRKCLYKNKSLRLVRRLQHMGVLGTTLVPHPVHSDELDIDAIKPDIIVCSVDLTIPGTRTDICRYAHERRIPLITCAVSTTADSGYCFVQVPGEACWACALKPDSLPEPEEGECVGNVGACSGILKSVAGCALYGIESIVMNRPRDWNYKAVSLRTRHIGGGAMIAPRTECPVCGTRAAS